MFIFPYLPLVKQAVHVFYECKCIIHVDNIKETSIFKVLNIWPCSYAEYKIYCLMDTSFVSLFGVKAGIANNVRVFLILNPNHCSFKFFL